MKRKTEEKRSKEAMPRSGRFWAAGTAALLCSALLCLPVSAAEAGRTVPLSQTAVRDITASRYEKVPVAVQGKSVSMGARLIGGVTYVPVRVFYQILYPAATVTYSAGTRTATVKAEGLNVSLTAGSSVLYANGRCFYTGSPITVLNDGRMYVPVRPVAETLCLTVGWDAGTRSVTFTGTPRPLADSGVYDSTDLYWLARIISAEARGEPLVGKIAVGNVVLNRVKDREFPNTVKGVIFDRKNGVQFSPVSDGSVYATPTPESVTAAKICLEGYTVSEDILYFYAPAMVSTCWAARNRPYAFTIAGHRFYK